MKENYYDILGITEDEKKLQGKDFNDVLKKKFRELSIKYHPDRNQGSKDSEEKFKKIAEAYDVLSNNRTEYDNPMSNFQFNGNMSMDEVLRRFSMDFGSDFGFGPFGFGGHQSMRQKGSDISGAVNITLEDVLNGTEKTVKYTRKKVCHTCHGSGKDGNSREEICPHCQGRGMINQGFGMVSVKTTCPYCGGTGRMVVNPCKTCGGSGLENETIEKTFTIPPGVFGGMVFNLNGLGNEIPGNSNIPGDLHIIVKELEHPIFKRNGSDLIMTINVNVVDAILGTKARVKTLDGKTIDVNIPSGSEEGRRLSLNGLGLPEYGTGNRGRLICVVHLVMPKKLNDKEVKLLEKLSKSENFSK